MSSSVPKISPSSPLNPQINPTRAQDFLTSYFSPHHQFQQVQKHIALQQLQHPSLGPQQHPFVFFFFLWPISQKKRCNLNFLKLPSAHCSKHNLKLFSKVGKWWHSVFEQFVGANAPKYTRMNFADLLHLCFVFLMRHRNCL